MHSRALSLIDQETKRQTLTVNLIASENYASEQVRQATGSSLTNKYAEGYPGKRYYAGCSIVDEVENYAIAQAKQLFGADHANVQPHAGSQANMAAYLSIVQPGDTILAMGLPSGGHLTHGHRVNFSGKLFNFVHYHVSPEDERLDYDEIALLAHQHRPSLIVAGASAYSRTIDFARIAAIAEDTNARFMADIAHIAGLIAADLHPSPVPVADLVTTTTHKTLRGPRGGMILCTADFAEKVDKSVMPGMQGGPLMHAIAAKAVAFEEAQTPTFKVYQQQVLKNAAAMSAAFIGLGYHIVSGGTDNHLFLINVKKTTNLTGKTVEEALEKCGIIVNRNTVPYDEESPFTTSGIRIGTPAITTRGFGEKEAVHLVHVIDEAIKRHADEHFLQTVKKKIASLCTQFPLT